MWNGHPKRIARTRPSRSFAWRLRRSLLMDGLMNKQPAKNRRIAIDQEIGEERPAAPSPDLGRQYETRQRQQHGEGGKSDILLLREMPQEGFIQIDA